MVGWKGYEFSPTKLQSFYIWQFLWRCRKHQVHNLISAGRKKKGDFQVHLGDFEWWKFITENFVEHFISDLFCPCRISKTVDGWEILQNVVYPAIYNEFCTSPKKCCFARLLINMTQGFSILSQVVNAVNNSGPPNHANVFQAIRAMSLQEGVGSGWVFGLERPKVWEVFLKSFFGNLWNVGPFTFCEATRPQMFVEILVFQSVEDTLRDEVFVIPNDISTTWKSGWASLLAIWKLPLITFARDSLRFASSMVGKSLFFFKWWLHDHVPWQKVRTISQKTNPRTWKTVQYSLIFQKASVFPVSAAFYGV